MQPGSGTVTDQLSIFDALASLNPQLVVEMEPEPGWVWARCRTCSAFRYIRRTGVLRYCSMTPGCKGLMVVHLALDCVACGKPVTARRRGADARFCSKKCESTS